MALTAKHRKYLKSLAHHLDPVVRLGRGRISPEVIAETVRSLDAHELIKVKVDIEGGDERKELAAKLAAETGAELVATLGKVAMIYRPRVEKPRIKLP
ncbi:MAG TPA: ribosome assembly RNA-binding protein YhbY [Thermoanaerobaculia bacterium]|nr:ribosome assembly RNA-binding protein YhbY [Thermoanaerobaculia bacterium]